MAISDQLFIKLVQEKRELQNLSESFILAHLHELQRLNIRVREAFESINQDATHVKKNKYVALAISHVRSKARKIFGVFQIASLLDERKEILSKKSTVPKLTLALESHVSTKERMQHYAEFFQLCLDVWNKQETHKPARILDIACGLNPVAWAIYQQTHTSVFDQHIEYIAQELSEKDCAQLQLFFDVQGIKGKTIPANIVQQYDILTHISHVDWCFLLKTLDTLEAQERYCTYKIMQAINAKLFIVSFPLTTVRGQTMQRVAHASIPWFEKMCPRLNLRFTTHTLGNEIIYFCRTNK